MTSGDASREGRKIDPVQGDYLGDGLLDENDRLEIGLTRLACENGARRVSVCRMFHPCRNIDGADWSTSLFGETTPGS